MGYLVLARKYRPQRFEELVGQEDIALALKNAITNKRIAHSYIFSGPRGVGKTSTARIFAKAINCEKQAEMNGEPCNSCSICQEISNGNSLDVIEIDGASNNGVEQIRNLRENVKYKPARSHYKIYLIDEVHMLTVPAFNALLKTLEEPPEHIIFIFATTEPQKIPLTILSRCQRYDFKRIPTLRIAEHLKSILNQENIQYEEEAIFEIAKNADGSLRDSESLLDQLIAFSAGHIKLKDVQKLLGLVKTELFLQFFDAVIEKKKEEGLIIIQTISEQGLDFVQFFSGFIEFLRNLLIIKTLNNAPELVIDAAQNEKERMKLISDKVTQEKLIGFMDYLVSSIHSLKFSVYPRISAEIFFFKLMNLSNENNIEAINSKLEKMKNYVVQNRKFIQSLSTQIKSGANGNSLQSPALSVDKKVFEKYSDSQPDFEKKKINNQQILTLDEKKAKIQELWNDFLVSLPFDSPIKNHTAICQIGDIVDDTKMIVHIRNKIIFQLLEPKPVLENMEQAFSNFFHFPMKIEFVYIEPEKVKIEKKESPYKDVYDKALSVYGGSFIN